MCAAYLLLNSSPNTILSIMLPSPGKQSQDIHVHFTFLCFGSIPKARETKYKPHPLRKLLKWSCRSSCGFLNWTGLMGNWMCAGSSGWDKGELPVNKEGERRESSALSQNRVHPTVSLHLGSQEMKITWLWNTHRLFRKAADNYKYEGGTGLGSYCVKLYVMELIELSFTKGDPWS